MEKFVDGYSGFLYLDKDGMAEVIMNTYTHPRLADAKDEMILMEELNAVKAEIEKTTGERSVTPKMFWAI